MEDTAQQVELTAEKEQEAKKRALQVFMRRRKLSRQLCVQFLIQADQQKNWDTDWMVLGEFRSLAQTAFEDPEDFADTPDEKDMNAAWDFAELLIKGVASCHEELDELISAAAVNWTLSRMPYSDRAILRLACYELLKSPKNVTPAIAINEAVELAKLFCQTDSARFINGVLDKVRRMILAQQAAAESPASEAAAEPPVEG